MKVADAMSRQVDFVTADATVGDASRLIFGRGINAVPVVKKEKVIGFVTENNILSSLHPSVGEYIEDPVHEGDFERMEDRVNELFLTKVTKIMSRNPAKIKEDSPLMEAQSIMGLKKVGRLFVVDKNGRLIGVISNGDIFRALIGERLNIEENEEYNDWLSKHYFTYVDWKDRLTHEIPDIVKIFKEQKVTDVLDIGSGIGMHAIGLAKIGYNVCAFERSNLMLGEAKKRLKDASKDVKSRVDFISGEFEEVIIKPPKKCQAAIFMGNSLSHNPGNYKNILRLTSMALSPKATIILQITNFGKVLKAKNRLVEFTFTKGQTFEEQAFLTFYDPPKDGNKGILRTSAVFDFDGRRWRFYGLRQSLFANITKDEIEKLLIKEGFKNLKFYGSFYRNGKWDYLTRKKFEPLQSDFLNIVAIR